MRKRSDGQSTAVWLGRLCLVLTLAGGAGCQGERGPSAAGGAAADQATASRPSEVDWPVWRGGPAMTGRVDGEADVRIGDRLALRWQIDVDDDAVSSPVVADGVVYITGRSGTLHARQLQDGAAIWRRPLGDAESPPAAEAPPTVHAGAVYVGGGDGVLYAFDATSGEPRWTFATDDRILASANIWVGRTTDAAEPRPYVMVGSYDNHLYCLDAATGELQWSAASDYYVNGAAAVVGDLVVFGGCDGVVRALDAASGTPRFTHDMGEPIIATPALHDGRLVIGDYGRKLVCLRLADGEVRWTYDQADGGFFSSAAIGGGLTAVGCRDGAVHAIDLVAGERRWRREIGAAVDGSPVIAGDRVVVGADDGRLYLLDLADGRVVWRYDTGERIAGSVAVVGDRVLVGTDGGTLFCFQAP